MSFLSRTSCSISFLRSSWLMAVESKASLTNSDTPGLVEISSSSSCGGCNSHRQERKRQIIAPVCPFFLSLELKCQYIYLLNVTDGNWRSFWSDVYEEKNHTAMSFKIISCSHSVIFIVVRSLYCSLCSTLVLWSFEVIAFKV